MKKFGFNLIYDNNEKNYLSCFEPIIENTCLPRNDDYILFLYYNKIIFYNQIRIKKTTTENIISIQRRIVKSTKLKN